jgi:excisionase family DNA binding protein
MNNDASDSVDSAVDEDAPTTLYWRPAREPTDRPASTFPTRATQPVPRGSPEGLWDAREVAAFLRVSRSWVYHRSEEGTLPCVRVGGLLRFHAQKIKDMAVADALSAKIVTREHEAAQRRRR